MSADTGVMRGAISIPDQIREAMIAHARFCYPDEACGLLAADETGRFRMVYALTNAAASPTTYTIDPTEHFRAMRHAERNGLRLAGAFHSHTHTAAYPSPTDVALAPEPDWLYVVVSLADAGAPGLGAFRIRGGAITEEQVTIEERAWP